MDRLEKDIIKDILAGRTERFEYIARTYGRRVFALIVRIVSCREDAEELAQDVMLKVFTNLGSFRADSSLATWIYRIAYTTAMSHARRSPKREVAVDETTLRAVADESVSELLDAPPDTKLEAALMRAIEALSTEERAMITLHYYENLRLSEICKIMNMTLSNIKVKLMRTRRKLYLMITDEQR
ncbi:MAG: sigma-70 family RNA polymerase sigma factor [Muribaculaceae bacterium]|nr:sigma-70 family RNA polymerase sigma factor [Muribaculaceae bacterium]